MAEEPPKKKPAPPPPPPPPKTNKEIRDAIDKALQPVLDRTGNLEISTRDIQPNNATVKRSSGGTAAAQLTTPQEVQQYAFEKQGLKAEITPQGDVKAVDPTTQRQTFVSKYGDIIKAPASAIPGDAATVREAITQQAMRQQLLEAKKEETKATFERLTPEGSYQYYSKMGLSPTIEKLQQEKLIKEKLGRFTPEGQYAYYESLGLNSGSPESYAKFKPGLINKATAILYENAQKYIPKEAPAYFESVARKIEDNKLREPPGVGAIYKLVRKDIPSASFNFASGYVDELRERPGKTVLSTAAFFVLPKVLKIGGRLAAPVISKFPKTYAFTSKSVSIALPSIYAVSVGSRVLPSLTPFQELGRISASEITPMIAGGYAGTKFWQWQEGVTRTLIGRTKIPEEEIISEPVRTGKQPLDIVSPRKHLKTFKEAKNPFDKPMSNIPDEKLLTGTFTYKGKEVPYPSGVTLDEWVKQYGKGALTEMYKTPKFQEYIGAKQSEKIKAPFVVLHAASLTKSTAMSDIAKTGMGAIKPGDFDYLPGGFVAPSNKLAALFLRIGKGNADGEIFSSDILNPYSSPKVMAIYPMGVRTRKTIITGDISKSGQVMRRFAGKEKYGFVDLPRVKTEPEGIIAPETELSVIGKDYYTTFRGVRVPIDRFKITDKTQSTIKNINSKYENIRKGYESYIKRSIPTMGYKVELPSSKSSMASSVKSPSSYSSNRSSSRSSSSMSLSSMISSGSSSRGSSSSISSTISSITPSSSMSSSGSSSSYSKSSSSGSSSRSSSSSSSFSGSSGSYSSRGSYYTPPPKVNYYPRSKNENNLKLAYKVIVGAGKRQKVIAEGLPEGRALKIGSTDTLRNLRARFRIEESGTTTQEDIVFTPAPKFFRDYKIVQGQRVETPNQFIQRRGTRLASQTEIGEIQYLKKLAKKR